MPKCGLRLLGIMSLLRENGITDTLISMEYETKMLVRQ